VKRSKNFSFHQPQTRLVRLSNGSILKLYSVSALARRCNRCVRVLRVWEDTGIVPPPIIKVPSSPKRWYTPREIEIYGTLVENLLGIEGKRDLHKSGFADRIKAEIAALKQQMEREVEKHDTGREDQGIEAQSGPDDFTGLAAEGDGEDYPGLTD